MHGTTRKIVMSAMFAALVCAATMLVKIPTPMKGYVNLGDCLVLLSGWLLSPICGPLAAGLGSALADLFSGYVLYAPATFVIKAGMAALACAGFRLFKRRHETAARLLGGFAAELWMVLGYYAFEGVLYGFGASAVNIPANAMQGAVGLILGFVLIKIFAKNKYLPH